MPVEQRSYGQGAQGEEQLKIKRISFAMKLRYYWDNFVSRPSVFVTIMIVGSALFALLLTFYSYANGDAPEQDQRWSANNRSDFAVRLWFVFSLIFMPAGSRLEGTNIDRSIAVLLWLGNLVFNSVAFAFVTAKLIELFNRLKSGRSAVIDKHHTLILGWSNRIFPLLKELNTAAAGSKKSTVIILSDKDRAAMLNEISSRASHLKNLRLVCRTGDITNPEDLERVNIAGAKSAVLLDSESGSDANVVATVLALKAVGGSHVPIIAEIDDAAVGASLELSTNGQVIPVRSEEIIARVTAQASRQVGLAAVVLDLLDFDGAEIYFTNVPALVGKRYSEAVLSFKESSVIGVQSADGVTKLNPAANYVLKASEKLAVIADDDTTVVYTGLQEQHLKRKSAKPKVAEVRPADLLIIGWSHMGLAVLQELENFLPKGSSITVAAQAGKVDLSNLTGKKFNRLKVKVVSLGSEVEELIALTKSQKFDEIIVLGYRKGITVADADSHTMLTMLHLNRLSLKSKSGESTRLIAEILDSRKASLARIAAEGDLVISDNLGALVLAQLSQNPALAGVFNDLFGPSGDSILIKPIEQYLGLGQSAAFGDLAAWASDQNESAIGYRVANFDELDGSTGVILNPSKLQSFTAKPGDSLVVIGKFE